MAGRFPEVFLSSVAVPYQAKRERSRETGTENIKMAAKAWRKRQIKIVINNLFEFSF